MLSAFAAPLSLVCAAGHAPPGFYPLGVWYLAAPRGFSCWLFHLAGSQACALLPLALVAFRLQGWTGGGGGGLLPLDLRGSGVGTVSFRPFSDGCLSLHWQAWRDRGPEPWVVVVLRFGYCLPFLGSPPFSMLRSLYFLTAPLPSRVLLWRRSPWPSLPWVQWSLLLSLLQGFLQPSLRDVVVLGVLTSSHDPLSSPLFLDSVSISDGDHSVCAPVRISWDWMAYIVLRAAFSSGAGPSCFSSPSALPLLRHCLSIQGSLLCPFHSSASLHLGLGSCFRLYPLSASPHEALTRRLTHPVFLSCLPRQGSSDCSLCLSRVGDCHTSPNVHPCAFTGGTVSRCAAGLDLFF